MCSTASMSAKACFKTLHANHVFHSQATAAQIVPVLHMPPAPALQLLTPPAARPPIAAAALCCWLASSAVP
jgi:hypothetical protein